MVLKSWRGNIVVKLFTTIGPKSWLVNLLRNLLRIFQDIPEELLRKSWEQFPGNSQELVLKNLLLEIPKNFHKFCRHFLWFFGRIGNKKFLGQSYENFLGMLRRHSSDLVPRNWLREIPRNSCRHFHWIFLERFLGISTNFPQNCSLGRIQEFKS